jgi:hypothetical protein
MELKKRGLDRLDREWISKTKINGKESEREILR